MTVIVRLNSKYLESVLMLKVIPILLLCLALPAQAEKLGGEVVAIADGDTLTLLVNDQQVKIRLSEIDTPEKSQPWGKKAKQALSAKVFREKVSVDVVTVDRYGRTVGKIWLDNRDINREMVAEGHAWVYKQYMTDESLLDGEREARTGGLGLWSLDNPIPPWEWRRGSRAAVQSNIADSKCVAKKYCKDMDSCEEAKFYLLECGLTRLDRDSDGIPCESICRE